MLCLVPASSSQDTVLSTISLSLSYLPPVHLRTPRGGPTSSYSTSSRHPIVLRCFKSFQDYPTTPRLAISCRILGYLKPSGHHLTGLRHHTLPRSLPIVSRYNASSTEASSILGRLEATRHHLTVPHDIRAPHFTSFSLHRLKIQHLAISKIPCLEPTWDVP